MNITQVDERTFVVDEDVCPSCGCKLGAYSGITDTAAPVPGDFSVCYNCTAYLVVDDQLKVQLLTADELIKLPVDVMTMLSSIRRILQQSKVQE